MVLYMMGASCAKKLGTYKTTMVLWLVWWKKVDQTTVLLELQKVTSLKIGGAIHTCPTTALEILLNLQDIMYLGESKRLVTPLAVKVDSLNAA